MRATITPILLNASSQNGAAIPNPPMRRPPSAGPMARLTLIPTLFAATAYHHLPGGCRDRGAYRDDESEQQQVAGRDEVQPTSAANAIETMVIEDSPTIKNRRRSTMSTSAPAGIAKRNIGRLFATWTIDTVSGFGLRLVMSQPEATLYIQVPTFETTVAVQITANARCRNGAHADAARGDDRLGDTFSIASLI
jgi:hypothetical protein